MSLLVYLLKVNLALVLCWALYWVAFRKLTFFQWNRFYLLGAVILSFFLPLLQLHWNVPMAETAGMGRIDWTYVDHLATTPVMVIPEVKPWSPGSILLFLYAAVTMFCLLRSGRKLRGLLKSLEPSRRIVKGRVKVFVQDRHTGSFTLFRRIYLDRYAFHSRSSFVLRHEMAHAVQLHSLDLLFMEFVTDLLWFNPFAFMLLRHVRENHEYLADRYAHGDRNHLVEYLECLKAETIRYSTPVPASYFKSSTIQKRIMMLTSQSSNKRNLWRYLGVLPMAALIFVLLHTPATPGKANAVSVPGSWLPEPYSTVPETNVPFLFPLPEKYKEKITWGYHKKAIHPFSGEETTHLGIDVAAPAGTPVSAAAEGVVRKASSEEGWGKLVVIDHGQGFATFYAHLDEIAVEAGMKVAVGQVVGKVGNTGQSTGPHLHYEVRKNGAHVNPSDYY